MSSASQKYFSAQLKKASATKHKRWIRLMLFVAAVFVSVIGLYNVYMNFVNAYGIIGYYVAGCVVYPPLRFLLFKNSQTPMLTLQMFYFLQQNTNVNVSPYDLVMGNNLTPWSCVSQSCCTVMEICEGNLDIVSWDQLLTSEEWSGCGWIEQTGLGPKNTTGGGLMPLVNDFYQYGLPLLFLVAMIMPKPFPPFV